MGELRDARAVPVHFSRGPAGLDALYFALVLAAVLSPRIWIGDLLGVESRFVSINAEDLIVALLVFRCFARLAIGHQGGLGLLLPRITWHWVLLTGVFGLGLAAGIIRHGISEEHALAILFFIKWVEFGLLFIVMQSDMRRWNPSRISALLRFLLVVGLGSAVAGIIVFSNPEPVQRAAITFLNPNTAGVFYLVFATLALAYVREHKLLAAGAFIACAVATILTFSRAALVGLIAASVTGILIQPGLRVRMRERIRVILVIGIALAVLLILFVPQFSEYQVGRLARLFFVMRQVGGLESLQVDYSFYTRVEQIRLGWELFLQQPFLGHGFRTLTEVFLDNQYSILLAETGILGSLAFLLYWGSILRFLYSWRKYPLASGLFASTVGVFVAGIGSAILFVPRANLFLFMLVALAGAHVRARIQERNFPRRVP